MLFAHPFRLDQSGNTPNECFIWEYCWHFQFGELTLKFYHFSPNKFTDLSYQNGLLPERYFVWTVINRFKTHSIESRTIDQMIKRNMVRDFVLFFRDFVRDYTLVCHPDDISSDLISWAQQIINDFFIQCEWDVDLNKIWDTINVIIFDNMFF